MIFTIGAILWIVGLFLYKTGREGMTDRHDKCEAYGALMVLLGACGVVISAAMLAWRYLP